ncbi:MULTISPECIES: hypothetical protein [Pseudomonas]|uniref:hypothetical protein n=1 Tax=Pseudomonas TaxID=286 RepID=UPI001F1E1D13|nr:hypothetical protein [Pseudomonas tohonis]GJN49466.1 hypothetical protein TUM20249_54520 [Pseudomonas tohonis]
MSHKPFLVIDGQPISPKAPREYAAAIIRLQSLEERREALARVPEEWRELVRTHLVTAWNHPQRKS